MTTAKLLPQLPKAHGLRSEINRRAYEDFNAGRTSEQQVLIVVVEPQQTSLSKTADGIHQQVGWQIRRLSVLEKSRGDDVDRALMMAEEADARYRFVGEPLPFTDDREILLRALQQWSDDTGRDLDAEWSVHYGDEYVAKPEKASILKLQEFAHHHGVITENPIAEPGAPEADAAAPDPDLEPVG